MCLNTLVGHTNGTCHIDVLPNNQLVSSSWDGTLRIWCLVKGESIQRIRFIEAEKITPDLSLGELKVLENARILCCVEKFIFVFDLTAGTSTTFTGHKDWVESADILPDGRLVSASVDKTIKIWNFSDGKCLKTIRSQTTYCMRLLPDNKAITASEEKSIKIWNLDSGLCVKTLAGHTSAIWSLAIISNEKIASCSEDKTIRIW